MVGFGGILEKRDRSTSSSSSSNGSSPSSSAARNFHFWDAKIRLMGNITKIAYIAALSGEKSTVSKDAAMQATGIYKSLTSTELERAYRTNNGLCTRI